MYGSIISAFGIISSITVSKSLSSDKDTLRITLCYPGAHFTNNRDFFYTYTMKYQEEFRVGDLIWIYAKRHLHKGNFIQYITKDLSFFHDYFVKHFVHGSLKSFNECVERVKDIENS